MKPLSLTFALAGVIFLTSAALIQSSPSALNRPALEDRPDGDEDHPFIEERGVLLANRGEFLRWPLDDRPPGDRRYAASGLPPGLSIDASSGEISGTPKLTGESNVVIEARRDHPEDPVAFMRFVIQVEAATAISAGPLVDVYRFNLDDQTGGGVPASVSFPGKSLTFTKPLPDGLIWDAGTQTLSGWPQQSGVSNAPYQVATPAGTDSGLAVINAERDNGARPFDSGGGIRLGIVGETLIRDYGHFLQRTDLGSIPPNGPVPHSDTPSPWAESGRQVFSIHSGLGRLVALIRGDRLFLSRDGTDWEETVFDFGPEHVFASERSILVTDSFHSVITDDGVTWRLIDPEKIGRVAAAVHTGNKWIVMTTDLEVRTSTDGEQWENQGRMAWTGDLWNLQIVWHGGLIYLAESDPNRQFPGLDVPNTYVPEDGLQWRLLQDLPGHVLRLVRGGDDLWAMTRTAVYHLPAGGEDFELCWMAPPGSTLFDIAAAEGGRVAVSAGVRSWYLDLETLPPQLQGPETFPSLDRRVISVNEEFADTLRSNVPGARFKAYHLPQNLTLDPVTGLISGTLTEPGAYRAIVSVENENGEGLPRVYHLFASVPQQSDTAKLQVRRLNGLPSSLYWFPQDSLVGPLLVEPLDEDPAGVMITARELPPGVLFDARSRSITGRTGGTGRFTMIFDIATPTGRGSIEIPLWVYDWEVGYVESQGAVEFVLGETVSLSHQAWQTKAPVKYFATGLPDGLSIDAENGMVTGIPTRSGTYRVTVGIEDAASQLGHPAIIEYIVRESAAPPASAAPTRGREVQYVADVESTVHWLSYPDDVTAEFLALPAGFEFVPPRTMILEQPLPQGIHTGLVRLSNATGYAENPIDFLVFSQPGEMTHGLQFVTDSGSAPQSVVGMPFFARIEGVEEGERLQVVGLPPTLIFNESERTVTGQWEDAGQHYIHLMTARGGTATAYTEARVTVFRASGSVSASYPVGLTNRPWSRTLVTVDRTISVRLVADGLPEGFDNQPPTLSGTPVERGRFEIPLLDPITGLETGPRMIFHVYDPPSWEAERRRARYLPARNIFETPSVAVLERFTPFSPEALLRTTKDGTTWEVVTRPADAGKSTFTDMAVGADYVIAGGDWWSSARNLDEFVTALSHPALEGIASSGSQIVGASSLGLVNLSAGFPSFTFPGSRMRGVAIGNGRIVGVGKQGAIDTFRDNGEVLSHTARAGANLKGCHLQ